MNDQEESKDMPLSVYSWGRDIKSQLGQPAPKVRQGKDKHPCFMLPTKIKNLKNVKSVHLFQNYSYAVTGKGDVYSWGANSRGRLGIPSATEEVNVPAKVPGLRQIVDIACGTWHVLALDVDGNVFSCGSNKNGELGRGGDGDGFQQVEFDGKAKHISAGFGVSFIVCAEQQRLYSFGSANHSLQKENTQVPTLVKCFKDTIKQIDCGMTYTAAVTTDGDLYTWGDNLCQQSGTGSKSKSLSKPTLVTYFKENGLTVEQVSCSKGEKHCHTSCVCTNGEAYAWGDQYKGQLGTLPLGTDWGHDVKGYAATPQKILMPKEAEKVKEVISGGIHSAVLTEDHKLYTFGCGSDGRLGHPEYEGFVFLYKESRPKLVEAFNGKKVASVASSYYHMMALAE